MPRARRHATSDATSTLSDRTKERIKSHLKEFIQKLIAQSTSSEISMERQPPRDGDTLKPFHEAILPPSVRAVSQFERNFSTRLGSTFEECALIIAEQYHNEAQRNYKIQEEVSKAALEEIDAQVRNFESIATQGQRLTFDQMVKAVLAKASSEPTIKVQVTADLYVRRKDGTEMFFEIKSPQPNKGQCLEVTQRLLRIHLVRKKTRPEVQAYFAMPYNPYGESLEKYQWNYAMNYTPFEEVVLIGAEFWNLIGGRSTYQELLAIYRDVGQEYEREILKAFRL
jgi:hypothetical protein